MANPNDTTGTNPNAGNNANSPDNSKELAAISKQMKTLMDDNAAMKKELQALKTQKPAEPDGKLATAVEALGKQVSTLTQENATMKKQLAAQPKPGEPAAPPEKPKVPEKPFVIDGRKFKFRLAQFTWKGAKITAKDAMTDESILRALVDMKSEIIKEIE